MRYFIIAVSIFCLSALSYVACTKTEKDNKQIITVGTHEFKQIPINWIGLWEKRASKRDLIKSVIREFEFQHQDYNVNFKFKEQLTRETNNRNVVEDSIVEMIRSGIYAWDIVVVTRNTYKHIADRLNDPLWGQKYLVDFDEYDWFKENHIPAIINDGKYKADYGGIYAGPLLAGENYGLWFNVNTEEKLGLSIKKRGMTFDDLLEYCQVVNKYNKSASEKIKFLPTNNATYQVQYLFNSLVLSELGAIEGEQVSIDKAKKAIRKGLNALEQLGKLDAIDLSVDLNNGVRPNINGQVLFTVQASYWYNKCESEDVVKALDMVPAELPVFKTSVPIYQGTYQSSWAVFKNSPHKNEAIELIKFFTSNDVAERWLNSTYNPTGLKVKLKSSDFGQNEIEKFNTYIDKKYGENLALYDIGELLFKKKGIDISPIKVVAGEVSADAYYNHI